MRYIKRGLVIVLLVMIARLAKADEGIWLPLLLEKLNEKQMKSLGMKISAKDIYNINSGSLKDAIVSFGGFCTGEVISSKGLVLTNHHCGFDAVQNHSTLDHNYIETGFWAKNNGEELSNPGLFVTFIVRIEDITRAALNGVTAEMSETQRQSQIENNISVVSQNTKKESYQRILVRPFFEGNEYYLFVTETYTDVRLVGAPPASIGNFGKDTDNWMWPRHTGDFSVFRIYAGKDNKPADYSPDNVPYVPKKSLTISLDGVAEKDFTMVFGFPGRTMEYLYSAAVEQTAKVSDPLKIAIRQKALAILDNFMRKDEQIKIQYAAKYSTISNYWKKWQGEVLGLTRSNAVAKKKEYETEFRKRVNADAALKTSYGNLLDDLDGLYKELENYGYSRDAYGETTTRVEFFAIAAELNALVAAYEKNGEAGYRQQLPVTRDRLQNLYNEYNVTVDRELFHSLMESLRNDKKLSFLDEVWASYDDTNSGITKMELVAYTGSVLPYFDKMRTSGMAGDDPKIAVEKIKNDPGFQMYLAMQTAYLQKINPRLTELQNSINKMQRTYMQAQREVFKEKAFYPDANSTLRVTYGNVKGYTARDAVKYDYYTYLDGVMQKYIPGDYEFDVPEKLRTLYAKKDYGPYGKNGKMPVCFIASNHTTGGNSGSPALDAYGNLVGLNFDRVWEGTMSDLNYDPSICRNIMVDIRYVLFIMDKYAGAGYLVKEMKLVHPKR